VERGKTKAERQKRENARKVGQGHVKHIAREREGEKGGVRGRCQAQEKEREREKERKREREGREGEKRREKERNSRKEIEGGR
jgi:hypothetical protein